MSGLTLVHERSRRERQHFGYWGGWLLVIGHPLQVKWRVVEFLLS